MIYGLNNHILVVFGDGDTVIGRLLGCPAIEVSTAECRYKPGDQPTQEDSDIENDALRLGKPTITIAARGKSKQDDLAGIESWMRALQYMKDIITIIDYEALGKPDQ